MGQALELTYLPCFSLALAWMTIVSCIIFSKSMFTAYTSLLYWSNTKQNRSMKQGTTEASVHENLSYYLVNMIKFRKPCSLYNCSLTETREIVPLRPGHGIGRQTGNRLYLRSSKNNDCSLIIFQVCSSKVATSGVCNILREEFHNGTCTCVCTSEYIA